MNLLNNLFDVDNTQLIKINKHYFKVMIFILILIIILFFFKKDIYYSNSISLIDDKIIIIVEKEYVNRVKESNLMIINDIETKYNINSITPNNDVYIIDISLNTMVNIDNGVYKIVLGKERLFDYIVRIIKK